MLLGVFKFIQNDTNEYQTLLCPVPCGMIILGTLRGVLFLILEAVTETLCYYVQRSEHSIPLEH